MEVTFQDRKLEKLAENYSKCQQTMGNIRAKLYIRRLNDLYGANSLEDVRNLPGRYHELLANRKGQFSCDLDQPYRLIFEPLEKPIPTDKNGKCIWVEIKGVKIIEIVDYH